jgi:hypothetical protein
VHLSRPFDPIAPGEFDNFAFDFSADVGPGASISSTSWTCALKPLQTVLDPAPQAHIIAAYAQTKIGSADGPLFLPTPPDIAVVITGAFSVARIGGFLSSQAGATYELEATVVLSDGRALTLSADLPVVGSGAQNYQVSRDFLLPIESR